MAQTKRSKPDPIQITEFLNADHDPPASNEISTDHTDPVVEVPVRICLDQIKEYDQNPRRAAGSEYETLKEGLRTSTARTVTLLITRRPGDEHYIPAMGGNTRLHILKELYAETGDDRYFFLNCTQQPWTSELDLVVGHMKENDHRSDYIYLDRARGIRTIKELMEAEGEVLSQRQFVERLKKELGYTKISQRTLIRYAYVLDHLYPYIPTALEAGLGKRTVEAIQGLKKQLDDFCKQLFSEADITAATLDDFFCAGLEGLDHAQGIDISDLTQRILTEVGRYITARNDGARVDIQMYWTLFCKDPSLTSAWSATDDAPPEGDTVDTYPPVKGGDFQSPSAKHPEDESTPAPAATDHNSYIEPSRPKIKLPTTLANRQLDLRTEARYTALAIAKSQGIESLHKPLAGLYGYFMDVPHKPLSGAAADIWWWLFGLAVAPQHLEELAQIAPGSNLSIVYGRIVRDKHSDPSAITLAGLSTNMPATINHQFFTAAIPDQNYALFIRLMNAIRSIRQLDQESADRR